jgi:D-glycero-D-manno-heptose 1,7-bisphosphate phosphatase
VTRGFVLLDRDGTIIREKHYLAKPEDVELLQNAATGLKTLQDAGVGLIVVTNQSGIARGYLDEATLGRIHQRMNDLLEAEGVRLTEIFHCPHLPETGCHCRKPANGMAVAASRRFGFDLSHTVTIGDKPCDIDFGRKCGGRTILVRTGYGHKFAGETGADYTCEDLAEAAAKILEWKGVGF